MKSYKINRQGILTLFFAADLILTGTVMEMDGFYRLNAQLIDVESGAVLDGYLAEFRLD